MIRHRVAVLAAALMLAVSAVQAEPVLRAVRLTGSGEELLHPEAGFWKNAPELRVAMLPQNIVPPKLATAAIKTLQVRAVHNGQWLAFRIEWPDTTRSDRIVVDNFGDQVAVELPVTFNKESMPSPMMGNPGGRVSILQWRAAFQRDLDEGEPSVRDLYPNAHADVYPDQVLRATDVRPYMGAIGLDNPISHPNRTPVLDQMAEGWGTMTVKPEQHADGRGNWRQGRWQVVIAHPLSSGDANDMQLRAGSESVAAFAVWDGGAREVGSRKAWSGWVALKVDQ